MAMEVAVVLGRADGEVVATSAQPAVRARRVDAADRGGGVASAGEAFGSPDLQELEALRAVVSKTLMRVDGKA